MLHDITPAHKYAAARSAFTKEGSVKYLRYLRRDKTLIIFQSEIKGNFNYQDTALVKSE